MSTQPTLVIGFGEFGVQVLGGIARQIRQAYGATGLDSLALIGFGVVPMSGLDPAIEYQNVYADPSDWLSQPEQFPTLQRWLDVTYFARSARTFAPDTSHRQLVRLYLMRYISRDPDHLFALLTQHASRVLAALQASRDQVELQKEKKTLTAYLVGAFDETAMSGLYLDIAHLLRLSIHADAEGRLLLYGVLPEALHDMKRTGSRALQGANYAVLRELRRYSSSVNRWQIPRRFDYETSDRRYQRFDSQHQLFYAVRLYGHPLVMGPTVREDMARLVANTIAPLLDARASESFQQYQLVNLYANREHARPVQASDLSTALVSEHHTVLASFPRYALECYFGERLAKDVFQHWTASLAADVESVLSQITLPWIKQTLAWQHDPQKPAALARHYGRYPDQLVRDIRPMLAGVWVDATLDRAALFELAKEMDNDKMRFHHLVKNILVNELGALDNPGKGQDGDYVRRVRQQLERAVADFADSLFDAVLGWLNGSLGLHGTLAVLRAVQTNLQQGQAVLEHTLSALRQRPEARSLLNFFEHHYELLEALPTPRRSLRRRAINAFNDYLNSIRDIVEHFALTIALEQFVVFNAECQAVLTQITAQLDRWVDALLQGENALQDCLAQMALTPLEADLAPAYLPLIDTAWADYHYQRLFGADRLRSYIEHLQWRYDNVQGKLGFVPVLGGRNLDGRPGEARLENFRRWLEHFKQAVTEAAVTLDMWDYVLSDTAQQGHPLQMADFLDEDYRLLPYHDQGEMTRPPQHTRFLLIPLPQSPPPAEEDYRARIVDAVEVHTTNGMAETYPSRVGVMTLIEHIPLESTDAYRNALNAYQRNVAERERRHIYVMPHETQAAYYEYTIQKLFKLPTFQFSDDFVVALGNASRVELFLWAWMLDFVKLVSDSELQTDRYALQLTTGGKTQTWYLNHSSNVDLVEAFVYFCHSDIQPLSHQAAIDYEQLRERIDLLLDKEAKQWMHKWNTIQEPFPESEVSRWVERLQSTPCAFEAARTGYDHVLPQHRYKQIVKKLSDSNFQPSAHEETLYRLLAAVAHQTAEVARRVVRRMFDTC